MIHAWKYFVFTVRHTQKFHTSHVSYDEHNTRLHWTCTIFVHTFFITSFGINTQRVYVTLFIYNVFWHSTVFFSRLCIIIMARCSTVCSIPFYLLYKRKLLNGLCKHTFSVRCTLYSYRLVWYRCISAIHQYIYNINNHLIQFCRWRDSQLST